MDLQISPKSLFPAFYDNSAIKALAGAHRWTVSGRLGDDVTAKGKAPIDVRALLDTGRVRGAWSISDQCLVTLEDLADSLPNAANAAFYLQAAVDGLMVIDVEPSCPAEIAANLLALPGFLYSETSMSGRGYHLVAAIPDNFHHHGIASSKRVLREEHGWYEILLDHWVTFTRRPVSAGIWSQARAQDLVTAPFASIEELYASLASKAKPSPNACATAIGTDDEAPSIKGGELIIQRTLDGSRQRLKRLDDFGGDHSRWEFSILGTLYKEMRRHLVVVGFRNFTRYSAGEQAWLLYKAGLVALPSRSKHTERRNGRPFLLDRAAAMVAANP